MADLKQALERKLKIRKSKVESINTGGEALMLSRFTVVRGF